MHCAHTKSKGWSKAGKEGDPFTYISFPFLLVSQRIRITWGDEIQLPTWVRQCLLRNLVLFLPSSAGLAQLPLYNEGWIWNTEREATTQHGLQQPWHVGKARLMDALLSSHVDLQGRASVVLPILAEDASAWRHSELQPVSVSKPVHHFHTVSFL